LEPSPAAQLLPAGRKYPLAKVFISVIPALKILEISLWAFRELAEQHTANAIAVK